MRTYIIVLLVFTGYDVWYDFGDLSSKIQRVL